MKRSRSGHTTKVKLFNIELGRTVLSADHSAYLEAEAAALARVTCILGLNVPAPLWVSSLAVLADVDRTKADVERSAPPMKRGWRFVYDEPSRSLVFVQSSGTTLRITIRASDPPVLKIAVVRLPQSSMMQLTKLAREGEPQLFPEAISCPVL